MSNIKQWYAIKHKLQQQGKWRPTKVSKREAPKRAAPVEDDPDEGPSTKLPSEYGRLTLF